MELVLAAMVLAVAFLVAADFFRTKGDGPHEHAVEPAHDAERDTFAVPGAGATAFLPQPVRAGRAGHAFDAGLPGQPAGQPSRTSPPAGGRQPLDTWTATPRRGSHGAQKNWLVRTRLCLLAAASAIAAALAAAGVIRAAGALRSAPFHSDVSSVRDGAITSALVSCVFSAAVLAAGVASAVILIRSVLQPLRQLQAGAVELAEVRLPDALRHLSQSGGESRPSDVRAMAVSSSDEIGEVARALEQIQGEVLRLAASEAGLRGKLNEMFADLSSRSQSLVERQIRLIDELEQGEQDTERLANLLKMDHIATRMRRYSQNLLVLAGHDLPGRWNKPVTLVNVFRAAVSEIEDYERVSFSAQPGIAVSGPAVNDVVHLIAELAENATSLSAPDTPVDISGRPLASGGVLVDVTDQGVGMNPDEMAQANWRLDNPAATDILISRNMGLLVVGRLAALHGIKVRLQPAKSGGLTALAWLPDAIVGLQDTAGSSGPGGGFEGGQSRRDAHEAAVPGRPAGTDPDRGPAEREAHARSLRPAPAPEDVQVRQRPVLRLRPPVQGRAPVPSQPPAAAEAPVGPEANPAEERRLPIYEAVESDWFRNHHKQYGGTAAAEGGWASPGDDGWHAAKSVIAPSSSGVTTAGLPVRVPRANLVPGAASSQQPAAPRPARPATVARDRLARLQRGTSEGRAATSTAVNAGDEDETT